MNIATITSMKKFFSVRFCIWLISVSFVLFQFFLQLSSGVVMGAIMYEMHLSAFAMGTLSSVFYIVYTCLQIPVGILFDRKNANTLLAINALICAFGCFLFAISHSLSGLFLGRSLIGAGSAFAFVGLSHILRRYYPIQQFGFMIGLSETLGFVATAIGMFGMGALVNHWGWRSFINTAGLVGMIIAYFCWKHIPLDSELLQTKLQNYSKQLIYIFKNKQVWLNGLFVGLSFMIVTVFGALWAIPFIQVKLNCNLQQASLISAIFFIGTAVSCPLFGLLATHFDRRRPLMSWSCLSTAALLLILLYVPMQNAAIATLLMFLIGSCCGAYMLAYTVANELAPVGSSSTCTGFTNTLAVVTTPILQPLIGYLLDNTHHTSQYSLQDYQLALLMIPLSLIAAAFLAIFLPEKN